MKQKRLPTSRNVNSDPHEEFSDAVTVSRFWRTVSVAGDFECWMWNGDTDRDGYGIFMWQGKRKPAHEMALSFSTGEKRHPALDTCHSCDEPACCNPLHLRFDTRKSNVRDMYVRGRQNNHKILTDGDIQLIRERRALGARQADIASEFGCSDSYISMVIRGIKRPEAGGPIENRKQVSHV